MEITSRKTYFYDLPQELIAQTPMEPRDMSKILVYNRGNNTIDFQYLIF